jgi:hypothetical protein
MEQKWTQGNTREQEGTEKNIRNHKRTQGNWRELKGSFKSESCLALKPKFQANIPIDSKVKADCSSRR